MLDLNTMVEAVLAKFSRTVALTGGRPEKDILRLFQTAAVIYACQGVKRNGGPLNKKTRADRVKTA